MAPILIVPGLHNSGPEHWQTWFETRLPASRRVEQPNWGKPVLADWSARIRAALEAEDEPAWIVAHSFGCLASIHAGLDVPGRICGAFLVAPANPDRFEIPHAVLDHRLPFPSLVVASENDPWADGTVSRHWAACWGSRHVSIGNAGHINTDAGYGPWPQGIALFEAFCAEAPLYS